MRFVKTMRRSPGPAIPPLPISTVTRVLAFVIASAFISPSLSLAQTKPEEQVVGVRTLLSRDAARPGDVIKAAIILKIQPGYHINDSAPLDEFLFPTTLTTEEPSWVDVLETYYPTGHRGRFAYSQTELVVYEGEAVFGMLLKVNAGTAPGTLTLKATLTYQACDSTSCLPPKELPFEIQVPVVAAAKEVRDINQEIIGKIPFKAVVK